MKTSRKAATLEVRRLSRAKRRERLIRRWYVDDAALQL
jgi:hypothetical protein